jgi:MFS family permease
MQKSSIQENGSGYCWTVLFLATVAQTTISIITQGLAALAPFFQAEFNLSRGMVGMAVIMANLGAFFTYAFVGKAADVFGERNVVSLGGISIGLISMGMIFVKSSYMLFLAILLMGFGLATATPGGSKAIKTWFSKKQRGMAMGIRQTGVPLGGMIAALVFPFLSIRYGWRLTLFVAGITCIVSAIVYYLLYKERSDGISEKQAAGLKKSLLEFRKLLSNTSFLFASIISVVMVASQFSTVTYMILYLVEDIDFSLIMGGTILAVTQFSGAVGRIVWGTVSDRLFNGDRKKVLMIIGLVNASMIVLIAFLTNSSPTWWIVLVVALLGFSAIGWNGLFITLISELVTDDQGGAAVGLALTITQIGIVAGPPLFGFAVDISNSYRLAWLSLSGLIWASLFLYRYIETDQSQTKISETGR